MATDSTPNFKEVRGNLWDYCLVGNVIVVPTNGVLTSDGRATMGAGVAKQAKLKFRDIDRRLGERLKLFGLQVEPFPMGMSVSDGKGRPAPEWWLVAFPTKYDWHDPSSLDLIARSAVQLETLATKMGWESVYLPEPGTGLGGQPWEKVKQVLGGILDERFTVVHYARPESSR